MQQAPKGYWSSIFFHTTKLMRQKQGVSAEDAFRWARHLVDANWAQSGQPRERNLDLDLEFRTPELVLTP